MVMNQKITAMNQKISKYMNIKRVEFIVTWQCGGKCKHCQIGDEINKPSSHKSVIPGYAADAIKKIKAAYNVTSVMTFGGEPLYYPETTAAIHKAATECGIKTRQIITNGYFTNNPEKSKAVANALADAGVNSLLLSVDAFHQERIPLEPVYRFANDAVDARIPGFRLHPAWLISEDDQNPYNTKTKALLKKFATLPIEISNGNNIHPGGSAAKFLREHFQQEELNLTQSCGIAPHTEPLTDINSISIVPNGDVMICGFVIGNIYNDDALDILARYNPNKNDGMCALIKGGVAGLRCYAKTKGIQVNPSDYCDACDVCHAIVKQLYASSLLSEMTPWGHYRFSQK